jgi:hypothetical protein
MGPESGSADVSGQHDAEKSGGAKGLYRFRRKLGLLVVLACRGSQYAIGNFLRARNSSFVVHPKPGI